MKSCTFFGHRYVSDKIEDVLKLLLIQLIEENNVDIFYVGSQGDFDRMVIATLKSLIKQYPHIRYYIVLAYFPCEKDCSVDYPENSLFPDGLEAVPPRYAIVKRNRWMIDESDYVVVYVNNSIGNASKFKVLSEKKGKNVINIAELKDKYN